MPRAVSGVAMISVGLVAILWGGTVFLALSALISGLMVWELMAMLLHRRDGVPVGLGIVAAASLVAVFRMPSSFALLLIVPILGAAMVRGSRWIAACYSLAILLSGYGLVALREGAGPAFIFWIVAVVVMSDIAGYFVGRTLGGAKFWPRVSPKKTWSGTVAGWICAALAGAAIMATGHGGWSLLWLSPLLAFAGQIGDIVESALKRRQEVKDSSSLIPGHGGVLDRFDALTGAVVCVVVITQLMGVPLTEG